MKSVPLKAFPRTLGRRGGAKKLRAQGRVPAVIYGRKIQPESLEVGARELDDLIHHSVSENLLVDLAVEGGSDRPRRLVLLQEVQHHALSGRILHVDFHEVDENEKVTLMIPLETVGEAVGVKQSGGILEHVLFKVKVRALPRDLPEFIALNVSGLEMGKSLHISEIPRPAGVEILGDPGIPVVSVAVPRTEAEEAAAAATPAAGEVEAIREKKDEPAKDSKDQKPAEKGKK